MIDRIYALKKQMIIEGKKPNLLVVNDEGYNELVTNNYIMTGLKCIGLRIRINSEQEEKYKVIERILDIEVFTSDTVQHHFTTNDLDIIDNYKATGFIEVGNYIFSKENVIYL